MRPSEPIWNVGEKVLYLGADAIVPIDRLGGGEIVRACLVADPQHLAQPRRECGQCRRHGLAHDPRSLTAAEDHKLDRAAPLWRLVFGASEGEHWRPYRVAGVD